jgi:hypothetical protein
MMHGKSKEAPMTRLRTPLLSVLFALALALPLCGADVPTNFLATHYYILSLGGMSIDLAGLTQTAQSAGYSIIRYDGATPTVTRGGQVVDVPVQTALFDESTLMIDGDFFHLRHLGDTYAFTVRPSEIGYELVVNPSQDQPFGDTLAAILTSLQQLGILGSEVNLDFASYAKADLKGPAAPEGVFIDSSLYGLTVAEDWFAYAELKGFTQVGLRVEVVAEKVPGGVLDPEFSAYVLEETEDLVKLLCPINELLTLAKSSAIGYVRTAYQPSIP